MARASTTDPVTAYAKAVTSGEIVAGKLVRLAGERHLRDLKDGHKRGLRFDQKNAYLVFAFYERLLCLNGGEHEGKPFVLQPWQKFILGSLFGWLGADGYRRFRTSYIEIGKGNGKSPLVAGMGIFGMVADGEPRAEIYAAATKKDQAMILFRDAVAMVDLSPALAKRIQKTGAKGREWNLSHLDSGSFFRPIASDDGQSGPRPHIALLDEIHEHKSPLVIDMLSAGTKGRRQALIVEITNSGYDRTSVCYQHHEYSTKVLSGVAPDDAWFAYVCQLDPCPRCEKEGKVSPTEDCPDCDDWRDERTWIKANPNLGVSVTHKYLREQVTKAKGMPAAANTVKRLNFCQWTQSATKCVPMDDWQVCRRDIDLEELAGAVCFGALDIGATSDFTAFSLLFPCDDAETVQVDDGQGEPRTATRRSYRLKIWFWLPEFPRKRDERMEAVIEAWKAAGFVRTTPGNVVDYDQVLADIVEITAPFGLRKIAVDRGFQGSQMCTNLIKHFGEEMVVAFPQGIISMNAPFREFLELIKLHRFYHDGNPVMTWMCDNTAAEERGGLMKPSKEHSTEKIDGVAATVMALGVAITEPESVAPSIDWI